MTLLRRTCRPAVHVAAVLFVCAVAVPAITPSNAKSQALVELYTPTEPVPEEDYESWSLFLICNPAWVLPERDAALTALYDRFRAFGGAIGPRHLAVWFWSSRDISLPHDAVDVIRSSAWCQRFGLPLGESPYIVVMTDYPGTGLTTEYPASFRVPEDYLFVALNGLGAEQTLDALTELAERIVANKIDEEETGTESFWRGWDSVFQTLRGDILGVFSRMRVKFNTQFFEVEYEPVTDSDE